MDARVRSTDGRNSWFRLLVLCSVVSVPAAVASAQITPPAGETCTMLVHNWDISQSHPTGPVLSQDEDCDDDIQIDPDDFQPTYLGEYLPPRYYRISYTLWIDDRTSLCRTSTRSWSSAFSTWAEKAYSRFVSTVGNNSTFTLTTIATTSVDGSMS